MEAADISFFELFWEASILVKAVMLILLSMSVASWAMIFHRSKALTQANEASKRFEDRFWSGIDLSKLYKESDARKNNIQGMELIFHAGFKEYVRIHNADQDNTDAIMDGSYRTMRVALSREVDELEVHLNNLATIGSISPYIGLFGTVWGIMSSFIALGAVQQATLAMVAPGIAEALIATAMGLFAAIPAVIAYNRFSDQVMRIENNYANFMEEFSSILHRQTLAKKTQD
ncbi:MAG: protein TolQ [Moritella sp.]|uniref:protein TolQ n=1 Tax=unclassified Moritella TaxID=2637987 RepID=UPI0001569B24|nr:MULTISPECIES: protein TolQ [unclassified Moritella]EDM66378.1 Putative TolQ protein [Moritella sp. PE36]NQZ94438.1 protein TolQ [Moritella sp.]